MSVKRNRRIIASLCLILSVWASSTAANAANTAAEPSGGQMLLRERAVSILRDALEDGDGWVKTHAAEALVWNGYAEGVKETLLAEIQTAGPPYRIGIWRALAQAQGNDDVARSRYIDKIREAFLDADGPDRLHALEALAILQDAGGPGEPFRAIDEGELQPYARWVLANSGNASDETALADLLDAADVATRSTAAYALRHRKNIRSSTLDRLKVAASKEPVDSEARVYLLGACYVHFPKEEREVIENELLQYARTGDKDERYEVCVALAYSGEQSHNLLLETLLPDRELDVRVGAANALLRIERRQHRGLMGLDWAVIVLYATLMLGVGWFYSRRQKNTEEYFVGSRNMKPFVVGISLFATLISTISFLAGPGEIIRHGPAFLWSMATIPIVYLIGGYVLIPVFMKLPITSAYQLLGGRLGVQVHLLGSAIFIMTKLVWMAMLTYVAAKAMVVMLGWAPERIPYVVIVAGLIAVLYTVIGGLRTVIITDVIQFFILVAGALLTITLISVKMGGVGAWWPTAWAPHWDVQPFFSLNPQVRVTVVGTLIANILAWVCMAGSDQVAIQRYLATRDAKAARRSFLITNCAAVAITVILPLVGLALLGFFRAHPELMADGQSLIANADYLFPHYIANYLPVGVTGLVVAAMFAAAMSSLDSGINSVTTVFTVDFFARLRKGEDTEQQQLKLARYLVLGIGTAVVLIASVIGGVPGNILGATTKVGGLFAAPLFSLFFMALFVRFSTPFGTAWGALYAFVAAALVAFWDLFTGQPGLSFQWIVMVSLVVGLTVGSLLSLVPTRGKNWKILAAWSVLAALPLVIIVLNLVRG